jgi:peptide deformylase
MKLKRIESTQFNKSDEEIIKNRLISYCKKNKFYAASTQSIGLPFRAFLINEETPLLLINPIILKYSNESILSQEVSEFDDLRKYRYVNRALKIEVQTDNLGLVVFEGNEENKEGLNECIYAQQMIDSLDGITIADRNVNRPVQSEVKYQRNQLVMAKSPEGLIEQIKYKHIQKYIDNGYVIM